MKCKEGRNLSSSIISKVYGQRGTAEVNPKDVSDEGGTGEWEKAPPRKRKVSEERGEQGKAWGGRLREGQGTEDA